jgi:hypothetical protein
MAMAAPVVQEQDPLGRRYIVGFVMPADDSAEDPPDPSDPAVRIRRVWTPWFLRRIEVVVPVGA